MSGVGTIGRQLRRVRRERSLTQEELAARADVSVDLIKKLEQGSRQSARIISLARLATALDVPLSELIDKRVRLDRDDDGGSLLSVRDVLLCPDLLAGVEPSDDGAPAPLDEVGAAVRRGWDAYWRGEFGQLARAVPGVVTEARLAHASYGPRAAGLLARAYQLAACLMVHMGKDDLAAIGAERAINAAAGGDDVHQWATVQGTYSWVLLHQGRLDEAERLAVRVANQIEPSFSAPAEHIAAWGSLLMTALAPAAAAGKDVSDYLSMAAAGAERVGRRVDAYETAFGPATVAMQAVHAHAVLGQPAKALKAAEKIRPGDLRGISHARHLLDLAQAHLDARHGKTAIATLVQARNLAPTWFRHQGLARSLVAELREQQQRLSPALRDLARSLHI